MKLIIVLLLVCIMGAYSACHGQTSKTVVQEDTAKQLNLLDEQVKIFDRVFTLNGAGDENPLKGANNYLELIEKLDMPEAEKQELREQYELYDLGLDLKN